MGGCWSNRRKIQFFSVLLETSLKPGGEKTIVRNKIQLKLTDIAKLLKELFRNLFSHKTYSHLPYAKIGG
jgi:hypothetical protein